MRIWQCTGLDVKGVGGVEKHIAEVSEGLRRLGHAVHIGRQMPREWVEDPSEIIVHTHGDLWPNILMLRKIRKKGLTWIHICHGTSVGRVVACREFLSISGLRGSVTDFLPARMADAAIAVGPNALAEARRYFRMNIPATVIPNGADPDIFRPLKQIELAPRLIFIGRSGDRVKNVEGILEACSIVARAQPQLQLWCAPGIDYDYEVHPFVKNLGPRYGSDLAEAMAQCRALILCSFYEGDPIVLHEAQALGLPVVVSDIPPVRDNLRGYSNAVFVNPRHPEGIAHGIRTAIFGVVPAPAPRIRAWQTVAEEFDAFYKQVTSA